MINDCKIFYYSKPAIGKFNPVLYTDVEYISDKYNMSIIEDHY